jgi:DnaJ-class molecular chaperone
MEERMPSAFDGYGPRELVKTKVKCDDCRGSGNGRTAKTPEGDWVDEPCPTCGGMGTRVVEL